jgi:dGTPase
MAAPNREDRLHVEPAKQDGRSTFERDRDRVLYTFAFRRLAGVTQVVEPVEGHIFHNRLTHTLEVAQVARRTAQRLLREQAELVALHGGIDPEAVEAAAFAHDIGHPPFGHVAEEMLDILVSPHDPDGFEGNAQSFRVVCRLAAHREGYRGLNLTRATLRAILKYPRHRARRRRRRDEPVPKFGAYRSEELELREAMRLPGAGKGKSCEASIMDLADDIAYSVHDFDDFCRAGLIPIHYLRSEDDGFNELCDRWIAAGKVAASELNTKRRKKLKNFLQSLFIDEPYVGTFDQRAELRSQTSQLIGRFVNSVGLDARRDSLDPARLGEEEGWCVRLLKRVVWDFVIQSPHLATIQNGQRAVIEGLFDEYTGAIQRRNEGMIPPLFRHALADLPRRTSKASKPGPTEARLAADIVAHFGDEQAFRMYARLRGMTLTSVTDSIDA